MERPPEGGNAEQYDRPSGDALSTAAAEAEQVRARIVQGIEAAAQAEGSIDHRTARRVAKHFSRDPDGPLALFVVSGAILGDELFRELYADFEAHDEREQHWAEALRSYCLDRQGLGPVDHWNRTDADRETPSGEQPSIWLGSLSDHNAGHLHGVWVDAWQDLEAIEAIGRALVRTSPLGDAEELFIADHDGFAGLDIHQYTPLGHVQRIASGIAEHGRAFAAWADIQGLEDIEDVERTFQDAYRGQWPSMEAYVEHWLEETDGYAFMASVPEGLKPYVAINTEVMARDWATYYYVVETPGGEVMMFDAMA